MKEFAKAIEFLLDNPDIAAKMGERGYLFLKESILWEKLLRNWSKTYLFFLEH
jgi:glycosyltransferase involved in cell wall biosynthesis